LVAVVILGGLAFISLPHSGTQQVQYPGPGQPLGAITPAMPRTTTADPAKSSAVTDLLNRRADALLRRDERTFLDGLDPAADPDFIARQRTLFANLAGVQLDQWTYLVHADDPLDVSGLAAKEPADELWAPGVDLHYALHGGDLVPTSRGMGYLFARHGGTWYLRSDTALDELGRHTWRGPWDFGPCQVTPTAQGIVLAHPGSEAMVARLVEELDSSVKAVSDLWGTDWSQRVALLLPDTLPEMQALVGPGFPVESVVAVAVADRVDVATHSVSGQRVVLNPAGSRALSVASLRVVLRHEITHVAARAETVDGSPMWLLEGFADYVGYRESGITLAQGAPDLAEAVKNGGPTWLPEDKDFRSKGKILDLAYQQAWSVARYVAEKYGENTLLGFYRKLAAAGSASAGETDDILRQVLGVDRAGLVAAWRQYLLDTVG
jgi:hypothetical protein